MPPVFAYLSDILVSHSADLLDVGSALGNTLEGVAGQDQLVLLGLGDLDLDTALHNDPPDNLLADEVSDLDLVDALRVLLDVDVDGEMGVDVSHLVLEALGDTDDQVVDEGADGAQGGDVLPAAMVDLNGDDVLLGDGEVDGQVVQVLDELACSICQALDPMCFPTHFPHALCGFQKRVRRCVSYLGGPRR